MLYKVFKKLPENVLLPHMDWKFHPLQSPFVPFLHNSYSKVYIFLLYKKSLVKNKNVLKTYHTGFVEPGSSQPYKSM